MKASAFLTLTLSVTIFATSHPARGADEPARFTKLSDIITTAPAGTIPSGRAWTAAELAKASEALATNAVGKTAQFTVKFLRVQNPNPAAAVVQFAVVRDDFSSRGRPYYLYLSCSIPRNKSDAVFSLKDHASLKVRGKISSVRMTGEAVRPAAA